MQTVACQPTKVSGQSFGSAVSRTKGGLPRIIPRVHREFIRKGSSFHIKLWLTLFSLYRVLDVVGKLSLATITTPGITLSNSTVIEFQAASDFLAQRFGSLLIKEQTEGERRSLPFWISTSSPNSARGDLPGTKFCSTHYASLIGSFIAWSQRFAFLGTSAWEPNDKDLLRFVSRIAELSGQSTLGNLLFGSRLASLSLKRLDYKGDFLGAVAFKIEPAGKIRVFAMVDAFTQWMLRPLHYALFDWLRKIPGDATFDQNGAVKRFTEFLTTYSVKHVFSFDLTAATDRLPVSLQVIALESLGLPLTDALAWKALLVGRWYKVNIPMWNRFATRASDTGVSTHVNHTMINPQGRVTAVKYAVGQPIGALSSWAMLAVCHHTIVAIAARRVNLFNMYLPMYLVLGDDIVIADPTLAKAYEDILREIGCPVNLTKSIVSTNGSFEFAKQFIYNGVNVSPVSWREMFTSLLDVRSLLALFSKLGVTKISTIASYLGHGYKAVANLHRPFEKISRSLGRLLMLVSAPGSILEYSKSFSTWALQSAYRRIVPRAIPNTFVTWVVEQSQLALSSIKRPDFPRTLEAIEERLSVCLVSSKEEFSMHSTIPSSLTGGPIHVVEEVPKIVRAGGVFFVKTLSSILFLLYNDIWDRYDDTLTTAQDFLDEVQAPLESAIRDAQRSRYRTDGSLLERVQNRLLVDKTPFALDGSSIEKTMRLIDLGAEVLVDQEDVISGGPAGDMEMYRSFETIVTINRAKILRQADLLRSQLTHMSKLLGDDT